MKAGRELDALVAEKVMGTGKIECAFIKNLDQETGVITTGTRWDYPPYSTDIIAALEVLEKWRRIRPNGEYGDYYMGSDVEGCSCSLSNGKYVAYHCHSIPHAVCLAVLKALGLEVG